MNKLQKTAKRRHSFSFYFHIENGITDNVQVICLNMSPHTTKIKVGDIKLSYKGKFLHGSLCLPAKQEYTVRS